MVALRLDRSNVHGLLLIYLHYGTGPIHHSDFTLSSLLHWNMSLPLLQARAENYGKASVASPGRCGVE